MRTGSAFRHRHPHCITTNTTNGKDRQIIDKHAHGLATVDDEVRHRIVSDRQLGGAPADEVDLAVRQLPTTPNYDLFLRDRGSASDLRLATGIQHQRQVVGQCSASSFQAARPMLMGLGADRTSSQFDTVGTNAWQCWRWGCRGNVEFVS